MDGTAEGHDRGRRAGDDGEGAGRRVRAETRRLGRRHPRDPGTGRPDAGPAAAFAYSVDELRLLCRLAGGDLPPSLTSDWAAEDTAVADVVAARALLARGALRLAHAGDPALAPTAPVRDLLAPLRAARAVIEVEHVDAAGHRRRRAAVIGTAGAVGLAEREPDIWEVTRDAHATLDAIADAADTLTEPEPPTPAAAACNPPTGAALRGPATTPAAASDPPTAAAPRGPATHAAASNPPTTAVPAIPGAASNPPTAAVPATAGGGARPGGTGGSVAFPAPAARLFEGPCPASEAEALELLLVHGVPAGPARLLAPVLAARQVTTSIRVARRLADEQYQVDTLGWVDAGPYGIWRIEASPTARDPSTATLAPTTAAHLYATVRDRHAYIAHLADR